MSQSLLSDKQKDVSAPDSKSISPIKKTEVRSPRTVRFTTPTPISSKSPLTTVKKEIQSEVVSPKIKWLVHYFRKWEQPLFTDDHPENKWVQAETVKDGNCSLDALAIVWGLPRNQKTYELLRFRLARFLPVIRPELPPKDLAEEQAYVRKKGSWLSDEDIVILVNNNKNEIIPVIFDTMFDPDAQTKFDNLSQHKKDAIIRQANARNKIARHQHTMFLGITPSMVANTRQIQDRHGIDAHYILVQHVHGGHWIVLGRQKEDSDLVETLFSERDLPLGLMDVFERALHVWEK